MSRLGVWHCAAVLAVAVSLVGGVAAQPPATFHADTRLVVLHVLVTNGRGELVTNLDRGAFSVYEGGRRQSITLFRRDDVPDVARPDHRQQRQHAVGARAAWKLQRWRSSMRRIRLTKPSS